MRALSRSCSQVTSRSYSSDTDCKVYWNLSPNIFRSLGGLVEDYESNIHSEESSHRESFTDRSWAAVNEKTSIDKHLSPISWIHTIVQNAVSLNGVFTQVHC